MFTQQVATIEKNSFGHAQNDSLPQVCTIYLIETPSELHCKITGCRPNANKNNSYKLHLQYKNIMTKLLLVFEGRYTVTTVTL